MPENIGYSTYIFLLEKLEELSDQMSLTMDITNNGFTNVTNFLQNFVLVFQV